jgi:enamine deaminase RidA (YjgF/YER057c/UK114 family)
MRFHFLVICLLALTAAGVDAQVRSVESAQGKKAIDALRSPAIDADGYVYVSGQSGVRLDGTLPDNIAEETSQSLENIKGLLIASGLTMEHVVYLQVYMLDVGEYEVMNGVFKKYFVSTPPA